MDLDGSAAMQRPERKPGFLVAVLLRWTIKHNETKDVQCNQMPHCSWTYSSARAHCRCWGLGLAVRSE